MKRRAMYLLAVTGVSTLCAACADPLVVYNTPPPSADEKGTTKFQLATTILKFDYPSGPNNTKDTKTLTITSAPVASDAATYTIAGTSWYENWGVQTDVTPTHVDGSLLLQQVATKVTDQRVAMISTASGIATDLISLGVFAALVEPVSKTPAPPTGMDVAAFIDQVMAAKDHQGCIITDVGNKKGRDGKIDCSKATFTLDGGGVPDDKGTVNPYVATGIIIGPVPDDAFALPSFPYQSGAFIYSACRSMQITVSNPVPEQKSVSATVQVADRTWLQATKLPQSGSVSSGKSCGADAQPGAYTGSTALDYVKALADAATNIQKALASPTSATASKSGATPKP